MSEITIDEMNQEIAIFDGWEMVEREVFVDGQPEPISVQCFVKDDYRRYHCDLKYHTSWNWIVPIVKKIYDLDQSDFTFSIFASIKEVHTSVHQVIRRYQSQHK